MVLPWQEEASFITGVHLPVDGGLTIQLQDDFARKVLTTTRPPLRSCELCKGLVLAGPCGLLPPCACFVGSQNAFELHEASS